MVMNFHTTKTWTTCYQRWTDTDTTSDMSSCPTQDFMRLRTQACPKTSDTDSDMNILQTRVFVHLWWCYWLKVVDNSWMLTTFFQSWSRFKRKNKVDVYHQNGQKRQDHLKIVIDNLSLIHFLFNIRCSPYFWRSHERSLIFFLDIIYFTEF